MDSEREDDVRWADVKSLVVGLAIVIGVVALVCGLWWVIMIPLGDKPYL